MARGSKLKLLLVADVYAPVRTSAGVQMRDLATTLVRIGHECTFVVPDPQISQLYELRRAEGVNVLRIRYAPLKRIGLVRRAVNELLLSTRMWSAFRSSPVAAERHDGVVYYSPTIFLAQFVARLKALYRCREYLILRDIFPEWAADLGVMSRGPHYWLFKAFARYQYEVADVIGIESPSNLRYLKSFRDKVEVLNNWIDIDTAPVDTFRIPEELHDFTLLVYAGNIGIAQDMDNLLRLARRLSHREDCRLLFVGDGTELRRIKAEVERFRLGNVVFLPEMDSLQLRGLLRRCHVGLITLNKHLRTHNIPGKLLSYLEAGLPILASVNPGNDLKELVEGAGAGAVCWNGNDDALTAAAIQMLDNSDVRTRMSLSATRLCRDRFSAVAAAKQIVRSFNNL